MTFSGPEVSRGRDGIGIDRSSRQGTSRPIASIERLPTALIMLVANGSSSSSPGPSACPRYQTCLHLHQGSIVDLYGVASSLALEMQRFVGEISRCLASRTSATLLLLTSGGLVVYLLFRRRRRPPADQRAFRRQSHERVRQGHEGVRQGHEGVRQGSAASGGNGDQLLDGGSLEWIRGRIRSLLWGWSSLSSASRTAGNDSDGPGAAFTPGAPLSSGFRPKAPTTTTTTTTTKTTPGGLETDMVRSEAKGRHQTSGPEKSSIHIGPCPNCARGVCKIRKHLHHRHHHHLVQRVSMAGTAASHKHPAVPSSSGKPRPVGKGFGRPKEAKGSGDPLVKSQTITPYNADDESSEPENEDPFVNDLSSSNTNSRAHVVHGDDERPNWTNSISGKGPSLSGLSCNNPACQDPICATSQAALLAAKKRLDDQGCSDCPTFQWSFREESVDSLVSEETSSLVSVSDSMVDLVKGAREIRRLIRETSLDSLASDFSLGGCISSLNGSLLGVTGICDDTGLSASQKLLPFASLPPFPSSSDSWHHLSQPGSLLLDQPLSLVNLEIEGSAAALEGSNHRSLQDPLSNPAKIEHKLWRIVGPLSGDDDTESAMDGPEGGSKGIVPAHYEGGATSDEEYDEDDRKEQQNLEWESPLRGWHDLRPSRYKVALQSTCQRTCCCSSDFEDENNLDSLEWDLEGGNLSAAAPRGALLASFQGRHHECWLPDEGGPELDLEHELVNGSSRRTSVSSDMDSSLIYRHVRLPPSGRSSVGKTSPCFTPLTSTAADNHESQLKSFLNSTSLAEACWAAATPASSSSSKLLNCRHGHRGLRMEDEQRPKVKVSQSTPSLSQEPPVSSSRVCNSFSDDSIAACFSGKTAVTTPLSPVHEVREPPRSNDDDDDCCGEERVSKARRNLLERDQFFEGVADGKSTESSLSGENHLPDLEVVT